MSLRILPTLPSRTKLDIFDRVFDDFWNSGLNTRALTDTGLAKVNVKETDKTVEVQVEVPGVDKKDISIEFKDGILSISGEKKEEKIEEGENRYYQEISYGNFCKNIKVGDVDFDKGKAESKNGVLKIVLPKSKETQAKRLMIS